MEEKDKLESSASLNDEAEGTKKEKKEDEGSIWGGIIFLAVIALAIWALVHFNPSETDHKKEIASVLTEAANEDMYLVGAKNFEYHSLGICSWTTIDQLGHTKVSSIGILGFVWSPLGY